MLPEVTFHSSALPPADRFECWRTLMSETHAPMDLRTENAHEFWVRQRNISLGEVTVYPLECNPVTFRRTPKLVRNSDPEAYHLSLVKRGAGVVTMGRETHAHSAFDYHTSDTSRPFEIISARESFEIIGIEIPKALLPLPPRIAGQAIGQRISSRDGMGALLATFLDQVTRDSHTYQPADGPRLGGVLADLVGSLFAGVLDADRSLTPETHRRALTLRIMAFIRSNADDPRLDIPAIAAAHHISVSYLHRLFQREGGGVTAAGFLQRQRLSRARRDLADPLYQGLPVHCIAARRGFSHASAFSRAFRDAYGMPPAAFRRQSLGLQAGREPVAAPQGS
ncbi:helix-turn-helix transcriptional regulator [Streptomyces bambusae]|uniref:Helix-turn-helix domain-containing protein n=1 Tax=Streptomyces bambusae TaxID=1550616 RepID=A0ABS6ZEH2_9ACTN|nr:AraC family transcriptional regulator [Streptomyces bambusae]MBW5486157.1 helix-turn-helix domain-containing protein [Streptomyces bambusae]